MLRLFLATVISLCLSLLFVYACSPGGASFTVEQHLPDAAKQDEPYPYQPPEVGPDVSQAGECISYNYVPTLYPRIVEEHCTDRYGNDYMLGYYDNQLDIECKWKVAEDLKTRCLPLNEQDGTEYADNQCTIPVVLASLNGIVEYIGLDTYPDAGTDAMWVVEYYKGIQDRDPNAYYLADLGNGFGVQCYLQPSFQGEGWFYLGKKVNPDVFVAQ